MKNRFKQCRESAGLSIGQVVGLTGYPRQFIEGTESKEKPYSENAKKWIAKLSGLYRVDPKYLRTGEIQDSEDKTEAVNAVMESNMSDKDKDTVIGWINTT